MILPIAPAPIATHPPIAHAAPSAVPAVECTSIPPIVPTIPTAIHAAQMVIEVTKAVPDAINVAITVAPAYAIKPVAHVAKVIVAAIPPVIPCSPATYPSSRRRAGRFGLVHCGLDHCGLDRYGHGR